MAEEINVQSTGPNTAEQGKTFTQAELDGIVESRLRRERSKYPSEEELSAYRTWKDGQQTEKERQEKREKEYSETKSALTTAQAELEQLKREKYVLSKGLTGENAEFITFKAAKMVDDKTTFEQAVDQLTTNQKKVTFDWTAQLGGGTKEESLNHTMNGLIRGAFK